MKIKQPYRCNVCKQPKGEGNKWLLMYNTFDCITTRWNEVNACQDSEVLHICGAVCAGKIQAEWIAKQIAEAQRVTKLPPRFSDQPTAVNVDGIELATPESSLPTIEEMSGLVDDFTDGMPLGEYLEDLRDG